jgi:hypothetical protein
VLEASPSAVTASLMAMMVQREFSSATSEDFKIFLALGSATCSISPPILELRAKIDLTHVVGKFGGLLKSDLNACGLDSRRNGKEEQAKALEWQIETIFAEGSAGAFVFAWTDEWHRGGYDVEDWDFGLTTRDRYPKPAINADLPTRHIP